MKKLILSLAMVAALTVTVRAAVTDNIGSTFASISQTLGDQEGSTVTSSLSSILTELQQVSTTVGNSTLLTDTLTRIEDGVKAAEEQSLYFDFTKGMHGFTNVTPALGSFVQDTGGLGSNDIKPASAWQYLECSKILNKTYKFDDGFKMTADIYYPIAVDPLGGFNIKLLKDGESVLEIGCNDSWAAQAACGRSYKYYHTVEDCGIGYTQWDGTMTVSIENDKLIWTAPDLSSVQPATTSLEFNEIRIQFTRYGSYAFYPTMRIRNLKIDTEPAAPPERLYLYKEGDECVDVTGGWDIFSIIYNMNMAGFNTYGTITKHPTYILLNTHANNVNTGIFTKNKIDITEYKKLYADIEKLGDWDSGLAIGHGQLSISTRDGIQQYASWNNVANNSSINPIPAHAEGLNTTRRAILSIDLTPFSGLVIPLVSEQYCTNVNVYNVWLEK